MSELQTTRSSRSAPRDEAATGKRPRRGAAATEAALRAFHEESSLGATYDLRLISRLWPFVRPYSAYLWLSLGLGVITAGLALSRPYLMRFTIDDGALAKDSHKLFIGGLLYAGAIITEQLLNFVQVYTVQISGARAMADLRRDVFAFLHGRRWDPLESTCRHASLSIL